MIEFNNCTRRSEYMDNLLRSLLDQSEKIRILDKIISTWEPQEYEPILANISPELERAWLLST